MRRSESARRGAPLVMLATVVGTWIVYRAVVWESPIGMPGFSQMVEAQEAYAPQVTTGERSASMSDQFTGSRTWDLVSYEPTPASITPAPLRRDGLATGVRAAPALASAYQPYALVNAPEYYAASREAFEPTDPQTPAPMRRPTFLSAQNGVIQPTTSQDISAGPSRMTMVRDSPSRRRWSGDAWALFRDGGAQTLSTVQPSYGRSQAGAVLRYELAPGSRSRPQAYARATTALDGPRQREIAAGASIRPVSAIPVRFYAEGRAFDTAQGTELRAAAFAITELPVVHLPGGFSGEAYAQAGYVTGDFATPFVDGQVRVTRSIAQAQGFRLEAGAGAWGGAQRDTGRLDIGPTVSVSLPIGRVNARFAADYRFRVAGEAAPASGPALTVSAGF